MSKIVVIGSGASGICTCLNLNDKDNEIILLEKDNDISKKILVTGNGRCNLWNSNMNNDFFYSSNRDLLDEILTTENKDKAFKFLNDLGIEYKVKNGYYYPYSNNATTIRNTLLNELQNKNIKVITNYEVTDIKKDNNKFIINNDIECDKLIISTGGCSYTNTNNNIFDLLSKMNHNIIKPLPSLVGLKTNSKFKKYLHGVRSDVEVSIEVDNELVKKEQGEIQFTDYGIFGICVFNLSRYASIGLYNKKEVNCYINFLPFVEDVNGYIEYRLKRFSNLTIYENLLRVLNKKLVDIIFEESNISKDTYSINDIEKSNLINNLSSFKVKIIDTNGYKASQVTTGGVDLKDINVSTMESKKVKDLYIIGEALDVDGDCGGYNLAFAFISALICVGDIND